MRFFLSLTAFLILAVPHAHAYVTPEQMFSDDQIFVEPPPNARNAKAARAAQDAQHDAQQSSAVAEPDEENDVPATIDTIDDLHGAAEDEQTEPTLTADERRDQRILDRIDNNTVLHAAGSETLHSGAPLADTGMGTIIAMLAGACAIGFTLRKAITR